MKESAAMSKRTFLGIALILSGVGCGGGRSGPELPDSSTYPFDAGDDGSVPDGGTAGRSGSGAGRNGGGGTASAGRGSAGTTPAQGGVGGGTPIPVAGAGTTGGVAGMNGRPPVFCDVDGYCLYPGGLLCYPDGPCCYPDTQIGQCCTPNECRSVPPWIGPTQPTPNPMTDPWVPPLPEDDVGEPGWRDSEDPLCIRNANFQPALGSIWSDSRGVFVASVVESVYDPNVPNSCGGCLRETVHHNDGSGWKEVEGLAADRRNFVSNGPVFVTGFDNGPLVLYGHSYTEMGTPCGLSSYDFDDKVRVCQPVDSVYDVAVVSDTLAYGLLQGQLIKYDGTSWGPLPIAAPIPELFRMWADETTVMALAGGPGVIYTLKDGMFKVEDTRTLENFMSIFGFSPTDVWAGTYQGSLFHYDGTAWTKVEWEKPTCEGFASIGGMWGVDGTLYFITQNSVHRATGTTVEKLTELEGDCQQFNGPRAFGAIWGASANEVYVSLLDGTQPNNNCGNSFMLYFDGSKFHHM
jgi:hypothetical protein